MRIRLFQVDAFTDRRFAGNPAAVCLLDRWLEDDLLQAVAAENNLSETAFLVPRGGDYGLRWFTPRAEVDLCGHATLASGFVVLRYMEGSRDSVRFHTRSGVLAVTREEERLAMDFPSLPPEPVDEPPPVLVRGLEARPTEFARAVDWLAVFRSPEEVAALDPDMRVLAGLEERGVIATAPAADGGDGGSDDGTPAASGHREADVATPVGSDDGGEGGAPHFVSRFFAPGVGVPEDPVTGSAHCTLAPYWARRLGRERLVGRQISRRGGEVLCRLEGDRVVLSGHAVLYLEGAIRV